MPLDDLAAQPGYQSATPQERRAMIAAEMQNDQEFRSLPAVEKQKRLLALTRPGEHPAAARLAGIQAGTDIPPGVGELPTSTPERAAQVAGAENVLSQAAPIQGIGSVENVMNPGLTSVVGKLVESLSSAQLPQSEFEQTTGQSITPQGTLGEAVASPLAQQSRIPPKSPLQEQAEAAFMQNPANPDLMKSAGQVLDRTMGGMASAASPLQAGIALVMGATPIGAAVAPTLLPVIGAQTAENVAEGFGEGGTTEALSRLGETAGAFAPFTPSLMGFKGKPKIGVGREAAIARRTEARERLRPQKKPPDTGPMVAPKPKAGLGIEYVDTPEGYENAQKIGSINLSRMGILDDQKKFIRQRGAEIEAVKKTITFDEIRAAANAMDLDFKDIKGIKEFTQKNRGVWLAARDFRDAAVVARDTAFKKWQEVSAKGTPQEIDASAKALDDATSAAMNAVLASAEIAAESGRGLASYRIESLSMPVKRYQNGLNALLEKMKDRSKTGELPLPVIEMLRSVDLNDPASIKRFMLSQAPKVATWNDKFHEFWISMLLSNPTTHFRNILGNSVALAGMPVETLASATAGAALSANDWYRGVPKNERMKRQTFFGEAPAQIYGAAYGLRGAWEGIKAGMAGELAEAKLDYGEGSLARAPKIAGRKGEIIRTPLKALQAADNAAKALVRSASIYQQAYALAAKEGLHGKALLDRAGEIVKYPSEAMLTKAHPEAQYRTFQKELGHWGKEMLKLRSVELGSSRIKPLSYVAPFMTTPINLLKYGTERTPLQWLAIGKRGLGGEYKGAEGRRRAESDIGKAVIGSIIAQQVWSAVQNGDVTGSGPTDQRERKARVDAGWSPYSIRVGDRWVKMTNIDPASTSLMLTADVAEIWGAANTEERKKLATMIVRAYGNNIQDKTFLSGITSAMDAIDDPDRYAEKYIGRQAGSIVPSIVAGAARAIDPWEREARTFTDILKARIPLVRETIMPRRDIRGKKIPAAGTGVIENKAGETAFRWLSPVQPTGIRGGKIEALVAQMGEAIPAVPRKMSIDFHDSPDPKKVIKHTVELSPEEYDLYQQFRGELVDVLFSALEKDKTNGFWTLLDDSKNSVTAEAAAKEIVFKMVEKSGKVAEAEMYAWLSANGRLPQKYAEALKEEALKRKRSFAVSIKEPQ